jgi:SAM-dependent methyltransferase
MTGITPSLNALLSERYPFVPASYWQKIDLTIADEDDMFSRTDPDYWAMAHYLGTGMEAAKIVKDALALTNRTPDEVADLLDFPCGYGRVLRHLRVTFPQASITGSEIFESCLAFCGKQFGINTFLSNTAFSIDLQKQFDVIWCGSLFTHISAARFDTLVQFFKSHLKDNGIMVFTIHGRYVRHHIDTLQYNLARRGILKIKLTHDLTGYGYSDYPLTPGYGISVTKPAWIVDYISKKDDLRMIAHYERGWGSHQDVIVLQKNTIYEKN